MSDCIFCKIANGEIPTQMVFEDEFVACFKDLEPQAPVHILIVPKVHIASNDEITFENCAVVGHIFAVAAQLAKQFDLSNGYRIVNNCGSDGGQSVQHLHFHLMGGRKFTWPAG